jgi:hypothetical protein
VEITVGADRKDPELFERGPLSPRKLLASRRKTDKETEFGAFRHR